MYTQKRKKKEIKEVVLEQKIEVKKCTYMDGTGGFFFFYLPYIFFRKQHSDEKLINTTFILQNTITCNIFYNCLYVRPKDTMIANEWSIFCTEDSKKE